MENDVKPEVIHAEDFAREGAEFILEIGRASIAERGRFRLGLSGGNTPKAVHRALVAAGGEFPWPKTWITFGDERGVPPDHEQSNFRMAAETLLDHVPIPPENILRMRGEIDPAEAAQEYATRLSALAESDGEALYQHDLLLLGIGADGHTASLFPGSPALEERSQIVIPTTGPKPPPQRLTMTYPLINAAAQICFLVGDRSKDEIIQEILTGNRQYPAGRVHGRERTVWFLGY